MEVEQIAVAPRDQLIAEIERLEGELQRRREAHRKTWRQLESVSESLRDALRYIADDTTSRGMMNRLAARIRAVLSQYSVQP